MKLRPGQQVAGAVDGMKKTSWCALPARTRRREHGGVELAAPAQAAGPPNRTAPPRQALRPRRPMTELLCAKSGTATANGESLSLKAAKPSSASDQNRPAR
ncbi:hypothetical protein [Thermomonospora sp. CIF 1]|uniref:hypothetical protein n=1 Tax=Thermomonospora sp. CIF 1 TaxID=1916083 RepID=UPI000CB3C313|nr:hypothetical protein [Thermomonospora sp. CIF 1]PKK13920.1 MAG: hypothetical protein BUE48_012645 [Thermomonospora sp. CIF 1]